MGMKLVGLVIAKWAPHMPDRAYRVLSRMAFSALDDPRGDTPAATYTGGREPLIAVMQDSEKRNPEALDKAIQRSIKQLIQLGAIERVNRAGPGQRAIYRLTLNAAIRIDGDKIRPEKWGTPSDPQWGTPSDPQNPIMGDTQVKKWGTPSDPPRRTKEFKEEQIKREVADLRGPVTLARDAGEENSVEKKCDNEDCEFGYRFDASKPKGQRNTRCEICRPTNVIPIPEDRLSRRRSSKRRT